MIWVILAAVVLVLGFVWWRIGGTADAWTSVASTTG